MQSNYMRTNLWQAVALVTIGLAIGNLITNNWASGYPEQPANKIGEQLYVGVTRGMMVPYFGEALPSNDFVWAPKHLHGKLVPNLNGRVLRGVDSEEEIGIVYGADVIEGHMTKEDGQHDHDIADHQHMLKDLITGPILRHGPDWDSDKYPFKDNAPFSTRDDDRWKDNEHIPVDGGATGEGQHRHILFGLTGGVGAKTGTKSTEVTSSKIKTLGNSKHTHELEPFRIVPSHVAVKYIIRIK